MRTTAFGAPYEPSGSMRARRVFHALFVMLAVLPLGGQVFAQTRAEIIRDARALTEQLESVASVGGPSTDTLDAQVESTLATIALQRDEVEGLNRCLLDLTSADLVRAHGDAMTDLNARQDRLQQAVSRYRSLRAEFPRLALRELALLGEARAIEALGSPDEAIERLESLRSRIGRNPRTKAFLDLRDAATIGILDILVQAEPGAVDERAAEFDRERRALQSGREEWSRSIQLRKAMAELAMSGSTGAVDTIRSLHEEAPKWVRLRSIGLIIDAAGTVVTPTPEELYEYADALVLAGRHEEALARYEAGGLTPDSVDDQLERGTASGSRALRLADALRGAGRRQEEAVILRAIVGHTPASEAALRVRITAAVDAAMGADNANDAMETLLSLVKSDAPEETRRIALNRWVQRAWSTNDPARIATELQTHQELVDSDPPLRYAAIATAWRLAQATNSQVAQAPVLIERLYTLIDDASGDVAIRASILCAQMLSSPEVGRAPEAVSLLESIPGTSSLGGEAAALQLSLLTELRLLDRAITLADQILGAEDVDVRFIGSLLDLAEALVADRKSERELGRAIEYARRAREIASATQSGFAEATLRSAEVLIACGRIDEAIGALNSLDRIGDADEEVRISVATLSARVLLDRGDARAALERIEAVSAELRDRNEMLLLRAESLMLLDRHSEAIQPLIAVRRRSAAETSTWCLATALLATSLIETGRFQEAAELLRAALILHEEPCQDNPPVPSLDQLLESAIAGEPDG